MTVDWEGASLDEDNIQAIIDFRTKYPHIAMLQFLNPVYFLRKHTSPEVIFDKINSTLSPQDEHGLHIHAWKSLTDTCGVPFQAEPKYSANEETCNISDCGYSVSLEYAYSQDDLSRLVGCSSDLLVSQGFRRPSSFRAGGWQLGPKLLNALEQNNFLIDSSRIDGQLLTTRWPRDSAMIKMLKSLHPESSMLDQPFYVSKNLQELPNNAALADYTSASQLVGIFKTLIESQKEVMVLGFHQETAVLYLNHLDDAIPEMEKIARKAGVEIKWAEYRR